MNRKTGGKVNRDTGPEPHDAGSTAPAELQHEQVLAEAPEQAAAGRLERSPADSLAHALAELERQDAAGTTEPPRAELQPYAHGGNIELPRAELEPPAPAGPAEQTQRSFIPAFRLPALPFQGLAADPRLPIWITRGLVAIAAAAAATMWQDWRLGLTAAALVIVVDIIYRSRTTSVIPAAVRVTSAQRRTRRRLALLKGAGYVALNARAIPGSNSVIDHLVIGPPGVFAVDSERWDRRLPVRAATAGRLYHGPFSQEQRLDHAQWEAGQATMLLSAALGDRIIVRPAMAIYGPTIPWTVASLRNVDVFAGRRLRKYFRRKARERDAPRLDSGQIGLIHAAAARALPPAR
jgi:hypothetical protein